MHHFFVVRIHIYLTSQQAMFIGSVYKKVAVAVTAIADSYNAVH